MNGEEGEGEVIIAAETAMPASNTRVVPWKIRYPALICSCLLGFAGYLVFDLCATLQVSLISLHSPLSLELWIIPFRVI